jgi:hypothetical protein
MKDQVPHTFEPWGDGLQQVVVYFPMVLTREQALKAQAILDTLLHQKSIGANVQFWVEGKSFSENLLSLERQTSRELARNKLRRLRGY